LAVQVEEQEELARRAGRALWIFRLTFYPAALALAVFLLLGRGGDAGPEPIDTYTGTTGQNLRFIVGLRDDRVVYFDTIIRGQCSKGGSWDYHWYPTDVPQRPFVQTDGGLEVADSWPTQYDDMTSQVDLSLDGRWEDDVLRGTLSYRQTFTPGAGEPFVCEAEDVAFTVQR
jgi:hypothetical protein